MKYHTLFLLKTRKDVVVLSYAAVVIGALRVKSFSQWKKLYRVHTDKFVLNLRISKTPQGLCVKY